MANSRSHGQIFVPRPLEISFLSYDCFIAQFSSRLEDECLRISISIKRVNSGMYAIFLSDHCTPRHVTHSVIVLFLVPYY